MKIIDPEGLWSDKKVAERKKRAYHEGMTTIDAFKARGGTIKLIPAKEKDKRGDPQYGNVLENCSECLHYNRGSGDKLCLRCKQYKLFLIKSVPRIKISTKHLPKEILEAFEGLSEDMPKVIHAIRQLPSDLSIVVTAYYLIGMRQEEIAGLLKLSQPAVNKKLSLAVITIKKIINK